MGISTLDQVIKKAEEHCNHPGAKLTPKRKNILILLLRSGSPLSAYELAERYQQQFHESVPPMSVYRMLDFLMTENLAHKLVSENKFIACSHIACNHQHQVPQFLICDHCNKVKEIAIGKEIIDALNINVTKAGYHLINHQLELHCLCDECSQTSAA
ncbi:MULTISPECIES: Fur family transcriptional regulator [Porticoccus]|jgi:Fur family transcriptional regulator, zinc uptake regulator|uniref:Fur family transcriptional regulator n=1 Tax=Porticoccus TaxID=1123967 RepID=UPI00055A6FCB|nr:MULTISPECIES: Fur family transcriptional regulator [Porticoccus]MAZ69254.1 transcriptional repressor [Porticoccus sp.]|tara:strand:- start:281 stop:751 length:471 start_codon:yes stop_codon:yes gene_type:complete